MFKVRQQIPSSLKSFVRNNTTNNLYNFNNYTFSTAKGAKTISSRFNEVYIKELSKANEHAAQITSQKYEVRASRTPTEAYVHPYHSARFPVYWSTASLSTFIKEAVGTEPVSPHYESYVRSRRAVVGLTGLFYGIYILDSLNLKSIYGQHAIYQLYTLLGFTICTFEIRYISMKIPAPRLTWFYSAYTEHEYRQVILNWQDKLEEAQRQFLGYSKEQIDYYLIHKEFVYIKKRSLSNFLENEKKNLDKNFYDRTVVMLKTIKNLEDSNVKSKVKSIADESLKALSSFVNNPAEKDNIHRAAFQSALNGLSKGVMTYENDPILPVFVRELNRRTSEVKGLTPQQENDMFALSKEQRKMVIENDNRAKLDFLSQAPNVSSAGVKNSDVYKSILGRMKARIDANFKK